MLFIEEEMKIKISKYLLLGTMLISIILTFNSCGDVELTSTWRNNEIKIDGNRLDWKDNIKFLKDEGVGVGILNDNHNLYLCLTLNDQSKMFPILRNGFTVWFDSPNNDKKTIGIEYPLSKKSGDISRRLNREDMGEGQNFNPQNMINRIIKNQKEFLVVNKDKFPLTEHWIGSDSTIQVKMGFHDYQLVYELKIPLADSAARNLYYVDAKPGQTLKIGFQTGEIERKSPADRNGGFRMNEGGEGGESGESGERPEGGMYPGGGRRRPGMDKGERRSGESFKSLDFEAEVKLAVKSNVHAK